ncbi:hypothetical protein DACRYDRAFT_100766 [Dacryopinax primogenitus]|uniref:Zn(2)-C6 fungal-type domain-containing protein n=1 Tax=Dacryopinax primogenitus (strain DJM 731) TaxID=1858805 RepID=M5FT38_DACPD|nr:uncharacterized protein DACRYDRAFT_100766 [Dacryopinax primogenitus]EJU00721.1 hypothetical protein DACRYDRAFT_100766 [Dacryopinax primogenitus]
MEDFANDIMAGQTMQNHLWQEHPSSPDGDFAWSGEEPLAHQPAFMEEHAPDKYFPPSDAFLFSQYGHNQPQPQYQHQPHFPLHPPQLRVELPHLTAGHPVPLLTPASTHASSPRSAMSTGPVMPFAMPGMPALSPAASPSTSSSLEPGPSMASMPPRVPALPPTMLAVHPEGAAYNPFNPAPYHAVGLSNSVFENTLFIKPSLPCGRQRIEQACDKCRERKARCNGGRPTCARCQQRGYECTYAPERRMRGPNKVKKPPSKGIQPRSSVTSLSGSTSSRKGDVSPGPSNGTPSPTEEFFPAASGQSTSAGLPPTVPARISSLSGWDQCAPSRGEIDTSPRVSNVTPSPTEQTFGAANTQPVPAVGPVSPALAFTSSLSGWDKNAPRKRTSTGDVASAGIRTPVDASLSKAGSPLPPTIARPAMSRSSSGTGMHERSHSTSSVDLSHTNAGPTKPRLSVEAPPDPELVNHGVFHPGRNGQPVMGLGVGVPTFPQSSYNGYMHYVPPPHQQYHQHTQQQQEAQYLPGIPLPRVHHPQPQIVNAIYHDDGQYVPNTLPFHAGSDMAVMADPIDVGLGNGDFRPFTGGGYRVPEQFGHKGEVLSPAHLAYMSHLATEGFRGHSRTSSSGTSALSSSPAGSLPGLPPHALSGLSGFHHPTFPTDARLDSGNTGLTPTDTSGSVSGSSDQGHVGLNPGSTIPVLGLGMSPPEDMGTVPLTTLPDMHAYGYAPITPPDSGDAASLPPPGPEMGISPRRTLGVSMQQFGY